jgi:pyrroline-5-carboxylate reductase
MDKLVKNYQRGKRGFRESITIGVVGFGHLGRSLCVPLVQNGFPKERLAISHKGRESTREAAMRLGLGDCLTDTESLIERADITIIATRPQDALLLPEAAVKPDALVISCMAGLPVDLLSMIFGGEVRRMMCSGPDTILAGRGVAAMFPSDDRTKRVMEMTGLSAMDAGSEEELDSFTVGICIPAILSNIHVPRDAVEDAMSAMEARYPVYGALKPWIMDSVRHETEDKGACLEKVSTKGGITEAMITSLRLGSTFEAALVKGMERGREITSEIEYSFRNSAMLAG